MATAPKTKKVKSPDDDLAERLAAIEVRIADQDSRASMAELAAQLNRIESVVLELRQDVPRLSAKVPQPLTVDEVETIMAANPGAKFISLGFHPGSGLRGGDSFDPQHKFKSTQTFLNVVRHRKLRVAAAA